jgi:protein-S-isoprenylcysteine O-methyltransferase Ste14
MPAYAYAILVVGWVVWFTPFLLAKRGQKAKQVDKRARWGMLIVMIAYSLLWQGKFWLHPPEAWRVGASVLSFAIASALSWTATRALGKQWRVDAGLSADHELVMAGPYRFVRHPIYTSMLAVLLGTGFMVSPWWLFLPALILFFIGTEIRVRIEDHLLAGLFGDSFAGYKSRVPAYIPFLK